MNKCVFTGVLAAAIGGCASSQHSTGTTTFARTDTGATVEVLLDEYKIHMPTTIPSGDITFHVRNTGDHHHNIEVVGPGVDVKLPKDLGAGEMADLNVKLEPGIYKVTCPVGPHAAMGMRLELTVEKR